MLRYIKDRTDQLRITKSCHVDPTSGHLGIMKTGNRIKERFMWKGIWADVKEMVIKLNLYYYYYSSGPIIPLLSFYFQVSKCDECQKMNKAPLVVPTVLQKIISDGDWLTDRIIDAVQNVLRLAHPHIGGLQSTILGETLTFDIQRGNFVQVLNVSRSHWITISNIGCEPETIAIYDSLGSGSVPARTSEQIAAIVFSSSSSIQLIFKSVQMAVTVVSLLWLLPHHCLKEKNQKRLIICSTSFDNIYRIVL